jgi:hypothetical protein
VYARSPAVPHSNIAAGCVGCLGCSGGWHGSQPSSGMLLQSVAVPTLNAAAILHFNTTCSAAAAVSGR